MSELIAVAFDELHTAEEGRLDLVRLKDEEFIKKLKEVQSAT